MDSGMEKAGVCKKENRIYFFLFLLVWCIQMLTAVYFCCQKQGFHEDEYYTYYSTARTYGLMIEDGAWMERAAYFDEFVVLDGQEFQYGLVKQVQSWDVHPPVYYWLFHTVCSFFPGQFSKWFGLGINLAAFGLGMFLLRYLSLKVTGRNEKLSLSVCFFYGFTPAAMSSVVFIRMYALLTVFVYLCAILHVSVVEKNREAIGPPVEERQEGKAQAVKFSFGKFLLPLMIVTYFGFLTQYYYFIFLFFMAFAFCIYLLWRDRDLWNCIRYGISLAVAFVLAYLTYPACLGQMFRGQRGAQATSNFFDLSNTWERISFFWGLLDEYVFGKTLLLLTVLLIIAALFAALAVRKRKKYAKVQEGKKQPEIWEGVQRWVKSNIVYEMLLFAVIGYFLTVSKTALLLGNTSVRYQTPVYGMVVLLLFRAVWGGWKYCCELCNDKKDCVGKKIFPVAAVLYMLAGLTGLFWGRVVFLYPEAAERVAFAREKAAEDVPVVCLYDAGQSWCVWDCADEFFEYDRIYFASQNDMEPISDAVIADSGELVVYLGNTAEKQEQLERIFNSNPNLGEYELLYQERYCDVYYFF
ncbi:MAG: glycosyltransferase family 39 protein [Lachnospiraceae bacterium]|nr:glycosyltransferase family 39 protein [Lachnospiraceae bacterium]